MSTDNKIEVEFGAKYDQLEAGVSKATAAVTEATNRMNSAFSEMGSQVKHLHEQFEHAFEGIHMSLAKFNNAMFAVQNLMAGGHIFGHAIDETVEFATSVGKLSRTFGITAEVASELNVGLKLIGMNSDEVTGMAFKMLRQLNKNEQGMNDLGVKTRDAAGAHLPLLETLKNGVSTMMEYKEGVDRDQIAMQLFGRGAQEAMGILRLNNEVMERAKKIADEYGLKVGQEGVEAARKFKMEQQAVSLVMEAMNAKIGEAIMPSLTKLAGWFSEIGPTVIKVFSAAIRGLITILDGTASGLNILWTIFDGFGEALGTWVGMMVKAIDRLAHFDLAGVANAVSLGFSEVERIAKEHAAKVFKIQADSKARIAALWSEGRDGKPGVESSTKGGNKLAPDKAGKEVKPQSNMSAWEAQLAAAKVTYETEHNLKEMSKQDEIAYWQSAIAMAEKYGTGDKVTISKKISELQLAILKKQRQEEQGLNREAIDAHEKLALDDLAIDEQRAEQSAAMGLISQSQLLAMKIKFEDQKYQIEDQAQQARIDLAKSGPDDPVAMQKLLDKKLGMHRKYLLDLGKLETAKAVEDNKHMKAAMDGIQSSMASSISSILSGQKSLANGLKSLWAGVTTAIIAEIGKITAAHIMGMLLHKQMNATLIESDAEAAAAGAYSAIVGIPYVGPFLAPAAAAVAYGAVLAFDSAEGGYDIPSGVNPMTQLHQKEMVLPAEHADTIRNLKGGGGDTHYITINAMDAKSMQEHFKANSHVFAPALRMLARNGER